MLAEPSSKHNLPAVHEAAAPQISGHLCGQVGAVAFQPPWVSCSGASAGSFYDTSKPLSSFLKGRGWGWGREMVSKISDLGFSHLTNTCQQLLGVTPELGTQAPGPGTHPWGGFQASRGDPVRKSHVMGRAEMGAVWEAGRHNHTLIQSSSH